MDHLTMSKRFLKYIIILAGFNLSLTVYVRTLYKNFKWKAIFFNHWCQK